MLSLLTSFRNFTIRFMPIPIIDASQALKTNPEKTEDALLKVCQRVSGVTQDTLSYWITDYFWS